MVAILLESEAAIEGHDLGLRVQVPHVDLEDEVVQQKLKAPS